jgi:DNA-binding GntR family transcriptional regulator
MPRADGRTAVIGSRGDEKRSMTASARIHEVLRDRIVALELPPGSMLPEKEFAESFGVSRTPVREALLRLAEEQLVDIYPQIGTFVAPIRVSVVLDAMVIRHALERFAVRAAAARAVEAEIAALDANLARQRSAAASGDIEAFHTADEAMHQLIANIAGHPNIWRVVKREKANVDRMRLLSLHFAGRFETVIAEHARIVEALREHRPDGAEAAMQAHLGRVAPSLEASRAKYPGYFEDEAAPQVRQRRVNRAKS